MSTIGTNVAEYCLEKYKTFDYKIIQKATEDNDWRNMIINLASSPSPKDQAVLRQELEQVTGEKIPDIIKKINIIIDQYTEMNIVLPDNNMKPKDGFW